MTLGLAELKPGGHESPAAELVSRARGEARRALDQLRDLVRGIHPQVLTDHGLTAAVAEVALRHPIPVTVGIDLPRRLPAPVESVAYFSVTEALTNAAKHSGASRIGVVGRAQGENPAVLRRLTAGCSVPAGLIGPAGGRTGCAAVVGSAEGEPAVVPVGHGPAR